MVTEIQLANNRLHFMYLQRLVGEIAGSTGMSRRDGEDMSKAILQVCVASLSSVSETADSKVSVTLAADSSSFTAEVIDRRSLISSSFPGDLYDDKSYSAGMESARRLVDSVELVRGCDETTIRLTKSADQESHTDLGLTPVPVLGVGLGRS
ncbi:MAG TPA: hypothetical protein VGK34_02065 [Armatimonadota bacterium]|jgi:hypothetical protein